MYSSTLSLTSALNGMGGQRRAPAALTPGKGPATHSVRGWVGLSGGGENFVANGTRTPDCPACSSVTIPTELPRPHLKIQIFSEIKGKLITFIQ